MPPQVRANYSRSSILGVTNISVKQLYRDVLIAAMGGKDLTGNEPVAALFI